MIMINRQLTYDRLRPVHASLRPPAKRTPATLKQELSLIPLLRAIEGALKLVGPPDLLPKWGSSVLFPLLADLLFVSKIVRRVLSDGALLAPSQPVNSNTRPVGALVEIRKRLPLPAMPLIRRRAFPQFIAHIRDT
jgi:hypothetical protein